MSANIDSRVSRLKKLTQRINFLLSHTLWRTVRMFPFRKLNFAIFFQMESVDTVTIGFGFLLEPQQVK
jgi:hypothetical protein